MLPNAPSLLKNHIFELSIKFVLYFRIPNRIHRLDRNFILALINDKNTSAAYIIAESKVDIMLGRDEMKENGQNLFHILTFNIGKLNNNNQTKFQTNHIRFIKYFQSLSI